MKSFIKAFAGASAIAVVLSAQAAWAESLEDVVRTVVQTNPRVQALSDSRNAVDDELRRARGLYLPQLDVEASPGYSRNRTTTTGGETRRTGWDDSYDASIIASQRLFDGFQAANETDRQIARARSAAARVFESAEFQGLSAIVAYTDVWRARELVELSLANVRMHEDMLSSMEQRQAQGGGSLADVAQTEARLARSRDTVLQNQIALRDAEAAYERVTGQAPTAVSLPPVPTQALPTSLEEVLAQVLEGNPTVRIFDADVEVAQKEAALADQPLYPQLRLEGGQTYSENRNGLRQRDESTFVVLRASWNLYRGGSDIANRRAALLRESEAKNYRLDAVREATESIRQSWNAYDFGRERLDMLQAAVDFSEQTRDSYLQQFTVGQRTLLDVLDAENELFVASGQLRTAEANHALAAYRLLAEMGRLLETLGVEPPEEANPAVRSFAEDVLR